MKKVFLSLWHYHRAHFEWPLYARVVMLLSFLLVFNYSLDFEDAVIDKVEPLWGRWLLFFLYEGVPFLATAWLLSIHGKTKPFFQDRRFWLLMVTGFLTLAFDRAFHLYPLIRDWFPLPTANLWMKALGWSSSLLLIAIPLMLIYELADRRSEHRWYGLAISKFDPKPYFYLLLIAGLFIGIGSFFHDIQAYYPRYRIGTGQSFAAYYRISQWVPLVFYELSYASNFITVELFFRGFLIYAFTRYFGSYAVLPMIVAYCVLHFGKPLTESLSSIAGGYALGILSLRNRNIWGGVIIHIGVAWLMELFGFLQRWAQHN